MSLRSALRRVYDNSSISVQTRLRMIYGRIPARLKLGREFADYSEEVVRNDRLTRAELDAMQLAKLRELIDHCWRHVPFYKGLFDRVGFKPTQLKTLADLAKIPPLSREDLRDHFEELRAVNASQFEPEQCASGGATGRPVKFLLDRKAIALEKACVRRHWLRAGYKDGEPTANLRGLRLAFKPGEYSMIDKGENCLYLSSYDLTPKTVAAYAKAFNRFRPALLDSYASSAALFANLVEHNELKIHSPQTIVCASETLYPHQRESIESVFESSVWDWYGLTELVGNASECELHNGYHISVEQGYFEVLDDNGRAVGPGEVGEIVATGLHNFSLPLIRYRTGDLGEFTDELCPCGRASRMIKSVQGRVFEFIETPSGARLTATALNVHDNTWDNVIQFQYVQKERDAVVLRVMKADAYTKADERRVLDRMGARFGAEIQLRIEYVSEMPKSPRGKTPLIVRELK
jgi:phenylacetate-coenzyme A ligase PaaK-like adenylate-forming protein